VLALSEANLAIDKVMPASLPYVSTRRVARGRQINTNAVPAKSAFASVAVRRDEIVFNKTRSSVLVERVTLPRRRDTAP
jgi:hypothetical protein